MFKNYWKIAIRQLKRQGFYSGIKIGGFAFGIATCLLIALYIRHELSYDKFYANGDRMYRSIEHYRRDNGTVGSGPAMPALMAQTMRMNFPQIVVAGRLMPYPLFAGAGSNQVRLAGGTEDIYEEGFTFRMHVVGVVADFNYESVKNNVDPLVLHLGNWTTVVAVKMNTADISGVVGKVSGVWKRFAPQQAIRYAWLDESFARMYADIMRTQRMFTSFAVLAIVIACLGLFALSAFMAEQRRKEIGIRKVTERSEGYERGGAWRSSLMDYVYRVTIGVWVFVVAGGLVLGIALATISVQALRAAVANPAPSLRSE